MSSWLFLILHMTLNQAFADTNAGSKDPPVEVLDKIEVTRASISEDERRQREALSHLFVINKRVKEIAQKQQRLNERLLTEEGTVRSLAQDVELLERRADERKTALNKRLRQLYQERSVDDFHWLFSAQSPVELERNHRFLRRMVDSDHKHLRLYLATLAELSKKRSQLKEKVAHLLSLQKQALAQEHELTAQQRAKSKSLNELQKSKNIKLTELKDLRDEHSDLNGVMNYAFFERKGLLRAPFEGRVLRDYGTIVDRQFRFRLTHKGLFYAAESADEIHTIYHGRVVFAGRLPGYGKTVIVDHGDNYYSVYAFASQLKVVEGAKVQEGAVVALTGHGSPLFGPGLYFEIRHFTDAIDPRPWIKDSFNEDGREIGR